jgi:hypothetical protein
LRHHLHPVVVRGVVGNFANRRLVESAAASPPRGLAAVLGVPALVVLPAPPRVVSVRAVRPVALLAHPVDVVLGKGCGCCFVGVPLVRLGPLSLEQGWRGCHRRLGRHCPRGGPAAWPSTFRALLARVFRVRRRRWHGSRTARPPCLGRHRASVCVCCTSCLEPLPCGAVSRGFFGAAGASIHGDVSPRCAVSCWRSSLLPEQRPIWESRASRLELFHSLCLRLRRPSRPPEQRPIRRARASRR